MSDTLDIKIRKTGSTTKGEQRKVELADHALNRLAAQSYAATSMRDIAAAADINLGRLHYYFEDKADLIVFTVRRFKQTFIADLRQALESGATIDRLIAVLVESATERADLHRFWYDLRTQALFESRYEAVVQEVETDLIAITEAVLRIINPSVDPLPILKLAHSALDGAFFRGMQAALRGDADAGRLMQAELKLAMQIYNPS